MSTIFIEYILSEFTVLVGGGLMILPSSSIGIKIKSSTYSTKVAKS